MVVNLKLKMESYSNDQLLHTLSRDHEVPTEIIDIARAIAIERGWSHRNIMERAKLFKQAKSEATDLIASNHARAEVVHRIAENYLLELEIADQLVEAKPEEGDHQAMLNCLRYFVLGIFMFYFFRILFAIL